MRIAREGFLFIIPSLFIALALLFFHYWIAALIVVFFFLFFCYFFRDPHRQTSADVLRLISPADGKVVEADIVSEDQFLHCKMKKIGIFMSPLDVHVNRAPCDGRIRKTEHRAGEFALAYKKDIDKENERNFILLEDGEHKILLVQIAGFLARRIICYVREGDRVKRGDRVGMIAFGSRVDIYVPEVYDVIVKNGDRVKAGITPVAVKRGNT